MKKLDLDKIIQKGKELLLEDEEREKEQARLQREQEQLERQRLAAEELRRNNVAADKIISGLEEQIIAGIRKKESFIKFDIRSIQHGKKKPNPIQPYEIPDIWNILIKKCKNLGIKTSIKTESESHNDYNDDRLSYKDQSEWLEYYSYLGIDINDYQLSDNCES